MIKEILNYKDWKKKEIFMKRISKFLGILYSIFFFSFTTFIVIITENKTDTEIEILSWIFFGFYILSLIPIYFILLLLVNKIWMYKGFLIEYNEYVDKLKNQNYKENKKRLEKIKTIKRLKKKYGVDEE